MTRLRAPASIANLGPGFDILAMAVDLWLEVEAEPADLPQWTWEGESAALLAVTENPISALPFRGRVCNGIPLGVGLGSSAAARLVAVGLTAQLGVKPPGPAASSFFADAAQREGHPDNAAAAVKGGIVAVLGQHIYSLPVPDLEVALLVATEPFSTERAREVLPVQVLREDAVHNAGRLALFVHALHTRRWSLLATAMEDRLHQPYRFALFPWVKDAITAARYAGAYGAALSGAGPSLFAFCAPGTGALIAEAMAAAVPGRGRPLVTRVTESGMSVQA